MDFNFRAVIAFIDLVQTQKSLAQYATTTAMPFLNSGRRPTHDMRHLSKNTRIGHVFGHFEQI